ncbi:MAG: sodium-independent anion transporter, partial [Clostridia bacterium]|nr:sodium-independent anion transporter [Clostridia bacterium]
LEELVINCNKKGIAIVLSHVAKQPLTVLSKSGLDNLIGNDNICANIDEALERASRIAGVN